MYTSYFALLGIAAQTLAMLLVLRPPLRVVARVGLAIVAGGAALVPWLFFALPQFQHAGAPFWVQPVGLSRIGDLWQEFVAGDNLRDQYPHAFEVNILRLLACGAAAVGGIAWMVMAWRARGDARRRVLFPGAAGLLAVVLLVAVSFARPLYDTRYAAMGEVPAVVAVGAGLAWLWPWRRPLGAVISGLALTLMAAHALALGPNPPNDDIRPLLTPLAGQVTDGDYVAINGATHYFTALYYTDAATQARTHVISSQINWYDGTSAYRPDTWQPAIPTGVGGTIYVLTADDSQLDVPAGFTMRDQRCAAHQCLQAWKR
jgi:hypothetical protein